jgi:hypothetical protein
MSVHEDKNSSAEARARAAHYRHEDMVDAYVRVYVAAQLDAPALAGAKQQERGCAS